MSKENDYFSSARRSFLRNTTITGTSLLLGGSGLMIARHAPAIVTSESARPQLPYGVMSGDVSQGRAVIWSKTDRSAMMIVEYSTAESFEKYHRVIGPAALEDTDFTAHINLKGLPSGQQIFYRVIFQDLEDTRVFSAPVYGSFKVPYSRHDKLEGQSLSFTFSGDEGGQGWGINESWGGYKLYETMRQLTPDFFIHSGDQIYADGVIKGEVTLDDGTIWRNIVTEAKSKVAITLDDFRGNFAYNLMDENKRRFAAEVPFLVQWDDHETRNNWYPGQTIGIDAYASERSASLLAARAKKAMLEYNPIHINPDDPERIYRSFSYGPLLDVFMLDERSYRGPNTTNLQTELNEESKFLGRQQLQWLKKSLLHSKATWKVIASDMPISLYVPDGNPDVATGTWEAWANGNDGVPAGRELEVAKLLKFIKDHDIKNVVWVTADVHYAQAIHYDPNKAKFSEFKPFWEFIGGPINAGTFGPNKVDLTFGADVKYTSVKEGMKANRPPSDGLQFFGYAKIDGQTRVMNVSLRDLYNNVLYQVDLAPEE